MSSDSDQAGSDRSKHLYLGASHGSLAVLAAVSTGKLYLLVFAILYPVVLVGGYLRGRITRTRTTPEPADRTPNPFGH